MDKPTITSILHLAESNPVLHSSLQYWKMGEITFEEALMLAVTFLVQQNEVLFNDRIKHFEEGMPMYLEGSSDPAQAALEFAEALKALPIQEW